MRSGCSDGSCLVCLAGSPLHIYTPTLGGHSDLIMVVCYEIPRANAEPLEENCTMYECILHVGVCMNVLAVWRIQDVG